MVVIRTMKVISLIISCYILLVNGKLIEKNTEKNHATKQTESPSSIRISRQAFYDEGTGISIEDYHRNYVRKGRYSIRSHKYSEEVTPNIVRVFRDSDEKRVKSKKQTEDTVRKLKNSKVLIKKPIPKFNEVDEEDFQVKVSSLPIKVADSGEHEDEDFNLDDYEFDVNHDEFVGRGKPLEPRAKHNNNRDSIENKIPKSKLTTTSPPQMKIQSKVVIPASPSNMKRSAMTKKAADKMKEDYYDDIVTTTKIPETEVKREFDYELSDDSGSKESSQKNLVRTIRSPLNIKLLADKMGDRTATILSNILAYLPLFPEAPISSETITDVANLDPITGREYMF
ncbi:unnamed protein product [Chilo suppressalis]|uniref:Seminal fluid protein n=1 Tax=Chilo suppressalis TaxID=168631 RepID=A0ABN8B5G1_CHISP|nr:unnamed protein product [Chilo suppressalis]